MTLKFINDIYFELFNRMQLNGLVQVSQAIGALILVVVLSKHLFDNFSKYGSVFKSDEIGNFSPGTILRLLGLILVILGMPKIFNVLDSLCVMVEEIALSSIETMPAEIIVEAPSLSAQLGKEGTLFGRLVNIAQTIMEYLNPLNLISSGTSWILEAIMSLVDMLIYPIFLSKRYFFMGMIKLFAPLLVAMSIFPAFKDYSINIFKMYIRYFLMIIPFFFVLVFTVSMRDGFLNMIEHNPLGAGAMAINGGFIRLIGLILSIILKIKLFKECHTLMDKLIP